MVNKILVAEDSKPLRDVTVMALRFVVPKGTEFVQADSRQSALQGIEEQNPDLVVTDLRMPGIGDGEVVIRAAIARGIAVIVLSSSLDDISEELKARCLAVISKIVGDGMQEVEVVVEKFFAGAN